MTHDDPTPDPTATFTRLRPRLQGIAYRMLGSLGEAEEVVQDVWLRWHEAEHARIESHEAWLVTATTRLAIDRLRRAKLERELYPGFWLPEPLLTDTATTPHALLERADDVSVAFLMLLERLSPEARAAFLLREVFDTDYADVARMVGKSEAACRQLVHRAKAQITEARPRYQVPEATHRRLLQGFAEAMTSGDIRSLSALLSEDAELIGDGGGKVPSFGKVLQGGQRIAQLYYASQRRFPGGLRVELVPLNGGWGLLRFIDGRLESAQSIETDGERILRIHVQRNPDKLAHIEDALRHKPGAPFVFPSSST
jgi:RNA polymerase sigma-70 factor (ECF subfamily)